MKIRRRVRVILLVLGVLTGILLVGCGGSSSGGIGQRQIAQIQVKTEVPSKVQVDHSYALQDFAGPTG